MPVVKFPYGKDFLELDIPESRYAGTLVSDMHHYNPGKTQEQLVQELSSIRSAPRASARWREGRRRS